jgi:hypothetical protein
LSRHPRPGGAGDRERERFHVLKWHNPQIPRTEARRRSFRNPSSSSYLVVSMWSAEDADDTPGEERKWSVSLTLKQSTGTEKRATYQDATYTSGMMFVSSGDETEQQDLQAVRSLHMGTPVHPFGPAAPSALVRTSAWRNSNLQSDACDEIFHVIPRDRDGHAAGTCT